MVKKGLGAKPITIKDLGEFAEQVILPAVETIVEGGVAPLREEMRAGFTEMRKGFVDINKSISVLGGDIAEIKENTKEQKHEERIRVLERKVGVR